MICSIFHYVGELFDQNDTTEKMMKQIERKREIKLRSQTENDKSHKVWWFFGALNISFYQLDTIRNPVVESMGEKKFKICYDDCQIKLNFIVSYFSGSVYC